MCICTNQAAIQHCRCVRTIDPQKFDACATNRENLHVKSERPENLLGTYVYLHIPHALGYGCS